MPTRFLTEQELRDQKGAAGIDRRADRDGDSLPDEGIVEGKILAAESEALADLLGRFTEAELEAAIPTVDMASPYLKGLIGDLALYYLEDHYDARTGKTIADYAHGKAGLQAIRLGQLSAVLTGSPDADSGRAVIVTARRGGDLLDQPLTMASMSGWGHRS